MSDQVTRELIAMVVRVAVIGAITAAFYLTTGFGDTAQTLAIGAAVAFGSQAAAFTVRRLMGDERAKPMLIVAFLSFAIGAALFAVLR